MTADWFQQNGVIMRASYNNKNGVFMIGIALVVPCALDKIFIGNFLKICLKQLPLSYDSTNIIIEFATRSRY